MQETAEPCLCNKIRFKHITAASSWLCHQCWKIQKSDVYYQCGDCPNCMNTLGDQCCNVCESCAFVPSVLTELTIADAVRTSLDIIEREIAACKTAEEIVDYLYVVHNEFHRSWIGIVQTTEIGSNEDFKTQFDRYHTMRSTALKKQQFLIDEMQLEIEIDALPTKPLTMESELSSNAQISLYSKLTKEWEELIGMEEKIEVTEFQNVACDHGHKCPCLKRVLFVNNLFQDHFIKPMIQKTDDEDVVKISNVIYVDLFQNCLSEHSAVCLFDDAYHIETMHDDSYNVVKCDCDDVDKECVGDLMRKYRRRERGEDESDSKEEHTHAIFDQFMNGLDDEQRLIMEVSAKMHDALCHRYDSGESVDSHEKKHDDGKGDFKVRSLKWWKKRSPSTQKANKFVNEVTEQKETKQKIEGGRMDDLHDVLIEKGMNESDSKQFIKYLQQNNYDSETVLDDMIDEKDVYNQYGDSNLFPELNRIHFYAKAIKKHFGGEQNDDDKLPVFSFGRTLWYYWGHYKNWRNYNQPKYRNLKAECVSNEIYSISMVLFNQILRKAMMYQRSRKGRRLKAKQGGNKQYDIPTDLPLTISHVFVLLLYCNFTKLQYAYKKKGCRKGDEEQTRYEFQVLNSEIGHWYQLLTEVIEFFGNQCSPKDTFYTGLNVRLNFSTFAPIWCSPFSTTIEIDVANRFSDGNGIILKLIPGAGSVDCYFNVEWLSDYDFEKERLFHHAFDLQIADIRYVELGKFVNNQRYLRAFALFSGLFSGHFICHLLRKKKKQPKAEKVLLDLITVYKENNGMSDDNGQPQRVLISLYIQQMFFNLIQQFRSKRMHYVIKSEYDKIGNALKDELFSFEKDYDRLGQITSSSFLNTLRPSLRIKCPMEYFWIIQGQQLIDLKNGGLEYFVYSEEIFVYKMSAWESIRFKFGLKKPMVGGRNMGIYLRIEKTATRETFNGEWSLRVEDLNWFYNGWKLVRLKCELAEPLPAFNVNLLDELESLTIRSALRFW